MDNSGAVTFRFVTISHPPLFPPRHNEMEGPLLALVPRAASLEERVKVIRQMRPRFRVPEKISAIWWPKYVHSLEDYGAWDRILRRMGACGYPPIADRAVDILRQMHRRERAEMYNAITGAGSDSRWEGGC